MTFKIKATIQGVCSVSILLMPGYATAQAGMNTPISPLSFAGIAVLTIFLAGLLMIMLESRLKMDKYIPALMMLGSFVIIGWHGFKYQEGGLEGSFATMLGDTKRSIFSLTAFLACMWMIVEILNERNVFIAISGWLLKSGCTPRQYFWATGFLCFILSPFISSITTALIFGKSTKSIFQDHAYIHAMLCNIIIASNAGIWFLGVSTTLMVLLDKQVSLRDIFYLAPASFIGWIAGAVIIDIFYLKDRCSSGVSDSFRNLGIVKPGGIMLSVLSLLAIGCAVIINIELHVDLEYALGYGFAFISFYAWILKMQKIRIPLYVCLQKVEWATLMYFVGILSGVSALGYVGWLGYLKQAYEVYDPTLVNIVIGVASCCVDNNVLEAAILEAGPLMGVSQWSLNMLLIAVGGSLTVVGSAPGIIAMTLDKSYNFAAHAKFLPAILGNFGFTILAWYVQYECF